MTEEIFSLSFVGRTVQEGLAFLFSVQKDFKVNFKVLCSFSFIVGKLNNHTHISEKLESILHNFFFFISSLLRRTS